MLALAVAGNVAAAPAPLGHQALQFRHGDAPAIRYGEAFAFDRGGAPIEVATRYDGEGLLELVVPAAFVDGANYPIVVDPAVGPVFNPGGPTWNDSQPDVAYDLDRDRYIVVWQRAFTSTTGIRGEIFDGSGSSTTGVLAITPAAAAGIGNPAVAFSKCLTSNAFLVVWESPTGIRGRFCDSLSGGFPASDFAISSPAAGEVDARPDVAGPGNPLMTVAWNRKAAAAPEPRQIMLRDLRWQFPAIPTSVIAGPERVLYGFANGYVRSVRLAPSDARLSIGGQNWFANRIVWERWLPSPAPGNFHVETASFRFLPNPSTLVVVDSLDAVEFFPGNDVNCDIASRADLHQDGSDMRFCIAWEQDGDIRARMYDLDGPAGAAFDVRATSNFEGSPAVGAGFCEFTVAYVEIVPPNQFDADVRAARVLLDGTVATDHRLIDAPSAPQDELAVASRPIHTSLEKRTNTTLITWKAQTGPAGGAINDVRARFFEPVLPGVFPYGVACPGPLGELAAIGTSGGAPIPGNDGFRVTIGGAPANSIAALIASNVFTTTPIPGAPGCSLYAGLPFLDVLPVVTNGAGAGSVAIPIPCSVPNATALAFQWAIYTPGTNAFGWVVSDDVDIIWSH